MSERDDTDVLKLTDEQQRDRARIQLDIMRDRLGEAAAQQRTGPSNDQEEATPLEVAWDTADAANFSYLYGPGYLLIRDEDVERVERALEERPRSDDVRFLQVGGIEDNIIAGLTLYKVPLGTREQLVKLWARLPPLLRSNPPTDNEVASYDDTRAALRYLDAAVGLGVATPDHIIHVTAVSSGCPATEPAVPTSNDLVPPISSTADAGAGVRVAVVDTGWYLDGSMLRHHPHLTVVSNDPADTGTVIVDDEDFEQVDNGAIRPYEGHGTFITGIVKCLAPATEVKVEGFLVHGGAIRESAMIKQLAQAIADGPDIINLSAGVTTRLARPPLGFEVLWERSLRHLKGTVLVAAAGNDASRTPFWPAAFPWAISVGALTPGRTRARFSNFGSWVDVWAPGVGLVNVFPSGDYVCQEPPHQGEQRRFEGLAEWSGTSFAAPMVTGMIAARMSATGESARDAADALLALARSQSKPGVGPWLDPSADSTTIQATAIQTTTI